MPFNPPEGYVVLENYDNYEIYRFDYIYTACCGKKIIRDRDIGLSYSEYKSDTGCEKIQIAVNPDHHLNLNKPKPAPKVKESPKAPKGYKLIEFNDATVLEYGGSLYTNQWFKVSVWAKKTVGYINSRGDDVVAYAVLDDTPQKPRFETKEKYPFGY